VWKFKHLNWEKFCRTIRTPELGKMLFGSTNIGIWEKYRVAIQTSGFGKRCYVAMQTSNQGKALCGDTNIQNVKQGLC